MTTPSTDPSQPELKASTFEVVKRHKRVTVFKLGKLWVFKHFFDDKEIFKALLEFYNADKFRFESQSIGERNKALKILDRVGFDYDLVEGLRPYIVKISRYKKYTSILKNSISHIDTPDWRIFLMKDLAAVEEAVSMGAEMYQGDNEKLLFD